MVNVGEAKMSLGVVFHLLQLMIKDVIVPRPRVSIPDFGRIRGTTMTRQITRLIPEYPDLSTVCRFEAI